jgi:hypothetical protein
MVIMVYHQEPEGDYSSGSQFVSEFEGQSVAIRTAANDAPNIFVAMDSGTFQYGTQSTDSAGTSCGYIVPTSYTDFYLADHYDHGANGMSLPNETNGPAGDSVGLKWSNWLSCVQPINKPIGLGEYGLDCKTNPDQPIVTQEMTADDSYLAAIPGATEPTIMWAYWYSASGISQGPGCMFSSMANLGEWHGIETQNGGG